MAMDQRPVSQFSDDLSSLAVSVHTVSTTSTTWGPEALSGKALKAIGDTSLDYPQEVGPDQTNVRTESLRFYESSLSEGTAATRCNVRQSE